MSAMLMSRLRLCPPSALEEEGLGVSQPPEGHQQERVDV